MNRFKEKSGFTLVETLVAMVILSIGVMALYAMQTTAIKGNATAISLTTASSMAQDRIERLLAKDFTDDELAAGACADLNDQPPGTGHADNDNASNQFYKIYWNVALGCTLKDIPNSTVKEEEQKTKHLRIFVVRKDQGINKTLVFNYIKQNNM